MKKIITILSCFLALWTQAQELLDYPLDTINGEEVYQYEVERSIGLYRIGVNFNISQDEIIRLNPQLRDRGLHYGELLYLPTGRKVEARKKTAEVVKKENADAVRSENVEVAGSENHEVAESESHEEKDIVMPADSTVSKEEVIIPATRRVIELALMLPFESHQTKRSGNAERMLEFYQGALLALQDLQNDSTLYRLRVYDTERSERRVTALCDSTELDSVCGVLGLIYPIQIERMAEWCAIHQVPLLLPFSDDIDLSTHPHVLQFNSTDKQEADSLCQWMSAQADEAHFIAVEVREADIASSIRTLRKQMQANNIPYTGVALRDVMIDSCDYALDATKENVFILHSDRFQQVRMLLPHLLKLQNEGYQIRIVSQYSWQKENIGLPQVYTSIFKNESDYAVYDAIWADTYKGGHVSESPRYDLLGYDLMQALVKWVESGKDIGNAARSEILYGLQSDIRWIQDNNGGWQNGMVELRIKN